MANKKEEDQFIRPLIKIDIDEPISQGADTSDASINQRATTPVTSVPRRSVDSIASLGSVATTTTAAGNHRFTFSMDSKSGSQNYSPLGNNSIYEVVMNTRYKHWLQAPTNIDITPVILSKNELSENWNDCVTNYVSTIKDDAETFVNRSDIKSINRIEEMKLYQVTNDPNEEIPHHEYPDEELSIINEENDAISQVPNFYFDKSFSLDNERIFRKVTEGIDLRLNKLNEIKNTDKQDPDANRIQQEAPYTDLKDKLSDYLDIVETSLVSELSKASPQFFYALSEVDHIQQKVSDTVSDLDKLNTTLKEDKIEDISKQIKNLKTIFKRKNIERLEQGLLQVKLVVDKVEICKAYYDKDDYDNSLGMIKSIDSLIRGNNDNNKNVTEWTKQWPYKLVDLKSVPALVETREFLTNMKIEVGGKLAIQLSDILLDDVRSHYENIDIGETLKRLQNGFDTKTNHAELNTKLQDSIKEIISKLYRCEELASAFNLYQNKALTECKNIIKKYLPSGRNQADSTSVSTAPSSVSLAAEQKDSSPIGDTSLNDIKQSTKGGNVPKLSTLIREQMPMEFQDMLVEIFARCSEAIRVLFQHQKILLDVALNVIDADGGENRASENQHNMITQLDIRAGVNEIISVVQLRMGKILAVRKEITSTLRYDHFLQLYAITVLFIQECEAQSGEFLTKYLSDSLASQIKHCISNRDTKNTRTIQKKIELENWQPFIVNPSFQKEVNEVVSCVDIDPLVWTDLIHLSSNDKEGVKSESSKEGQEDSKIDTVPSGNRKSVVVGDNTFVASDSLLTAITLIRELLILSINLPSIYLPYFEKLCFNLLKCFNTYTIGTVTMPGRPMKSFGKNLSIMAETLDCLAEFVGIVQRFYQRISNTTRDFEPYDPSNYASLLKQYRSSTERIYAANAPPPPT
ncbi:similar to Saccharomyces cerevisiae YDR027C VPS54 Component of the GARP (Golgi-associated retrograde protein) complex [Maudiozyma saulgeensis]|uniref:Similar to Saccharomyces cerevisiae YDR027C VPS54 Component of the GARP (Golgi-associated retrograde protein) complex n=1 Tax=Maudiozyma saulgeensis TaxID=1789683 RepID=A0A1X7R3S1_9SACH|nr:similar to Saccharomyces cerevisiae YDR027C VPS54 Component of the GARP (Golgi-associated retrograde protein) complex [Kazachstania saulgeensis]